MTQSPQPIFDTQIAHGVGGWFPVPNLSHGYHGLMRQWWEFYGLGKSALLVSESTVVREVFEIKYPGVRFVSTDYFLELSDNQRPCDVIWNLYTDPPKVLSSMSFDSVICSALLEHVLDPVGILRRLVNMMNPMAYLYLHTVSTQFGYHAYPRDYLRYFRDWFEDLRIVIPALSLVELFYSKKRGHLLACYQIKNGNEEFVP